MAKFRATVVLLGASNLTRGFAMALAYARAQLGGPLDVYAAIGAGRSYGLRTRVLVRELPGIKECALWRELEVRRDPDAPCYGLVTDLGNDVLYRAPVADISGWVEDAIGRLAALKARTTLVQLPISNILGISDLQFWLLRNVLFPGRALNKESVRADALALVEAVKGFASRYQLPLVEHEAAWYGLDPIHFRRSIWPDAWGKIIGAWGGLPAGESAAGGTPRNAMVAAPLRLPMLAPDQRWILGREQRGVQPTALLEDGTRVHIY